jgi:hypothetical protein
MALDHGLLNLPLAKRGNIDAQLDAHKREQAKQAAAKRKANAAAHREAKAAAKVALAELAADADVLAEKAAKLGITRKQLIAELTDWSKWQPQRVIRARNEWLPADGA